MNNKPDDFLELSLKSITPQAESWPDDLLHFQLMKAAVFDNRDIARKARVAMDNVDADVNLSPTGREAACRKIETEALAKLDTSTKHAKAKESYDGVMAKWDTILAKVVKPAKDHTEAVLHAQIRDRLFNLKDLKERMAWLERDAGDPLVASALLTVPPFLSGLTDPELALVRGKVEKLALSAEVIDVRAKTIQAWQQVEAGQRAGAQ